MMLNRSKLSSICRKLLLTSSTCHVYIFISYNTEHVVIVFAGRCLSLETTSHALVSPRNPEGQLMCAWLQSLSLLTCFAHAWHTIEDCSNSISSVMSLSYFAVINSSKLYRQVKHGPVKPNNYNRYH